MIPRNYRKLISILQSKTEENDVEWNKTGDTNSFSTLLGDKTVVVNCNYNESFEQPAITFYITDEDGHMVDEFLVAEEESDYQQIWELFCAARRKADNIDQTIDELYALLDEGKALIGEKTVDINGKEVGVKFYKDRNGWYTFTLSHYFQNPDQMAPYVPGGGSMADSESDLERRLDAYVRQVTPLAIPNRNPDF